MGPMLGDHQEFLEREVLAANQQVTLLVPEQKKMNYVCSQIMSIEIKTFSVNFGFRILGFLSNSQATHTIRSPSINK